MMKKSISEVEIRIDNADFENLDNVEKALRDTVMTRIRPCRVIIDMTSLRVGFGVLKKTFNGDVASSQLLYQLSL